MTFRDRVTRERVTLGSAEVTEIGEHEYEALLEELRERREDE